MREKTIWICEECNREFLDEKTCKEHEAIHIKSKKQELQNKFDMKKIELEKIIFEYVKAFNELPKLPDEMEEITELFNTLNNSNIPGIFGYVTSDKINIEKIGNNISEEIKSIVNDIDGSKKISSDFNLIMKNFVEKNK